MSRGARSLGGLVAASLAVAVAGCHSDRSLAPMGTVLTDAQVSADLAVSSGHASAMDMHDRDEYLLQVGMLSDRLPGTGARGGAGVSGGSAAAPRCDYSEVTGRWTCAPFTTERGVTIKRSYAFFDAAGKPMRKFSDSSTARVNYQTEKYGPVGDGIRFSGVTHRTSNETASGLVGAEARRVWDGSGVSADTVTYTDSATRRHYAGVRLDSLKGVTFAHPRLAGTYPLAGQAVQVSNFTVSSTGRSTETRSVSRRVVTTYNGTELARVQSGRLTCTLHLDTGKVDDCHK